MILSNLFRPERFHRIDDRRAAGWDVTCEKRRHCQEPCCSYECRSVDRRDTKQERRHQSSQPECRQGPKGDTDARENHPMNDKYPLYRARCSAQRDSDSNLTLALRDSIGEHAVDADNAEQERRRTGDSEQRQTPDDAE